MPSQTASELRRRLGQIRAEVGGSHPHVVDKDIDGISNWYYVIDNEFTKCRQLLSLHVNLINLITVVCI